jgi:hypothetical protein
LYRKYTILMKCGIGQKKKWKNLSVPKFWWRISTPLGIRSVLVTTCGRVDSLPALLFWEENCWFSILVCMCEYLWVLYFLKQEWFMSLKEMDSRCKSKLLIINKNILIYIKNLGLNGWHGEKYGCDWLII